MMRTMALSAACALAFTWPGEAPAQAPPVVTPTPEHASLGYYVGTWKTEGEMKPSPFGPAGKLSSQDECQWFEGKFAVVCRGQGTTYRWEAQADGGGWNTVLEGKATRQR